MNAQSPLEMAQTMKAAAAANTPFTDTELDLAVASLKCLIADDDGSVDWDALRALYAERAHLTHKDWEATEASASTLTSILGTPDSPRFRKMFSRVLEDGNWDGALQRPSATQSPPWVVLVTGLNGIRKSTSVYQAWWKPLLCEALGRAQFDGEVAELPSGTDSFFRQLDYMIATLALEQFKLLYTISDDVALYSEFKAGIFARYRTVAEMLGILLCQAAQQCGINVMVETSGRDVGMYKYVDHVFPGERYRKLVINFSINEIGFAERSVDTRMLREMREGAAALANADAEPLELVRANAGGPYGSQVLAGVQADSVKVWQSVLDGALGDAGNAWSMASIAIEAADSAPWKARPLPPPASKADSTAALSSTSFEFSPLGETQA